MPELGFQDLISGFRARDISPDSVIFTGESNFSLFSSASVSVERSSSASDVPDQVYLVSQVSQFEGAGKLKSLEQHLAGRGFSEGSSGPDPDPNKSTLVHKKSLNLVRREKAKVHKLDSSEAETTEDGNIALDSARNSFSIALKECQDRRLRSEVILTKADRRRPASLDLNNSLINATNSSSPRFGAMKKPSITTKRINAFPSPGTPNYRNASFGIQKGWSSERIPPHMNRRNVSNALLPYNNHGRTLPSKWEDAERWIFSPMSGDGDSKASLQQQKGRPKSKSGPLGPPGVAYQQMFSPATPMFEGGHNGKLIATSPFLAGDGMSVSYGGREGSENFHVTAEPCIARSISIHGCSEMLRQSSLHGQIEEKYDETEDESNNVSRTVSRRDMATQMSPESSIHSSPSRRQSSFSLANSIIDLQNITSSSRTEIRDVTIDERVSMTRWSKNIKTPQRRSSNSSASWRETSSDSSKSISKSQREEAKITAWENLQKAKAEAAIRKLEMKLEKKRSSSMDKIMKKLRSAQKKAQEMRSSGLPNQNQPHDSGRSSNKSLSFRKTPRIVSLSGCFNCHAFTAS